MSGKLKANYNTGEGQVLLPFEFHDADAKTREALLKCWINGLLDELNLCMAPTEPQEDVAELEDIPLPPHDKITHTQVEADK
jgi:hypothetical protein